MSRWLPALLLAATVVLVAPPRFRRRAFALGWFERSSDTDRRRGERRPTHGGLIAAVAVAVGAVLATGDARLATIAAVAVAAVASPVVERRRAPSWALPASRIAAAVVVPLAGARAELTGTTAVDVVLTALIALGVIAGLAALDHTDATMPVSAAVPAMGLLVLAVDGDLVGPAAVAAAVAGAAAGLLAHTLPPGDLRLGRTGPTALGAALTVAAVEAGPAAGEPRLALAGLLPLAVLLVALLVPGFELRLVARHLPPALTLGAAGVAAAVGGVLAGTSDVDLVVATALALVPVLVLAAIAATASRPGALPPRRRWVPFALAGVVVIGAVVAAGAALGLRDARASMLEGRDLAEAGLDAARAGDLDAAVAAFADADAAFAAAEDDLASPLVRAGALVPGVAQNLESAKTLADVGQDLSGTAVTVAERAGADDLLVVDGTFPVEAAAAAATDLEAAHDTLVDASSRLIDADSAWLVPEAREAVTTVTERVVETTESIEVAAEATRLVPAMLGAGGPRRWFVAIMSPAELRGAGGIMGDFAEIVADGGHLDLERTAPIAELNAATDPETRAAELPPTYAANYSTFEPERFWQNLPTTPDVPTMATAIVDGLPGVGVPPAEGVVTVTPVALAALLELTGPVTVPDWPEPITAENAVEVMAFEAYDELDPAVLDTFQGDVVAAVVDALTSTTLPPPSELAATLAPAVAGGHLQLWSGIPDEQALFARIGADGTLEAPDGTDHVEITTQNGSEAKIDWYLRRQLQYEATYDPETGQVDAVATVTLTNLAPSAGVAEYVIGGAPGSPTGPGENRTWLTLRSALTVVEVTDGAGNPIGVSIGEEGGMEMATLLTTLPPDGGTATFRFRLAGAIEPDETYRVAVGHQPTLWPDEVQVTALPAAGWTATDADYSFALEQETLIEVPFEPIQ